MSASILSGFNKIMNVQVATCCATAFIGLVLYDTVNKVDNHSDSLHEQFDSLKKVTRRVENLESRNTSIMRKVL